VPDANATATAPISTFLNMIRPSSPVLVVAAGDDLPVGAI